MSDNLLFWLLFAQPDLLGILDYTFLFLLNFRIFSLN